MVHWDIHPQAADLDPVARIRADSAALADAAAGRLDAPVEHCPGWDLADLVHHLFEVQHFWRRIVDERIYPEQMNRPEPPAADSLIATFRDGTERLAAVLASADPATPVWTWAPQQDAGFVIRHQVQEAAVHRWDAENAAGTAGPIDRATAIDSIEEFVTFSTNVADAPPLGTALSLDATDADTSWTVQDGPSGTLRWYRGGSAPTTLRGTASDLLLWLYGRAGVTPSGDAAVVDRFRAHVDTS